MPAPTASTMKVSIYDKVCACSLHGLVNAAESLHLRVGRAGAGVSELLREPAHLVPKCRDRTWWRDTTARIGGTARAAPATSSPSTFPRCCRCCA